ncbi:MAG: RNA polymerase sigma factor [Gemmatimonadota bacterium]
MDSTPRGIEPGLVRRAQAGDRAGLRALVEAAYPLVRRWALVRTGDAAEADDLTQDVMIQMIRTLDGFRGEARFETWLYAVTRNAAAARARRARRRDDVLGSPAAREGMTPSPEPAPDVVLHRRDVASVVRDAFFRLPLRQREVFDLVELQGLTSPEAAERLGIEAVSVRAHLFKARRALRARILGVSPELAEGRP